MSKRRSRKQGNPAPPPPPPSPAAPGLAPERRSVFLLWLLAALLTLWSFGFTTMMGSDLWWHLASGRWIWENRTLNFKDPWSFTRFGQAWAHHEWFSGVMFHAWSRLFGMTTLVWWKWMVLVAAFMVLFLTLRRLQGCLLAAYLGTLLAVAVGAPFFDMRPQLYTVLGFTVLLRLALLPSRLRWLLPVVLFLWVNLHAGFFFGLATLTLIFVLARLFGEAPRNTLPLWIGCVVACLANPGGPEALTYPLHYLGNAPSAILHIGEWTPPWIAGGIRSPLFFPAVGVFALAVAATFVLRLERVHPRLTYTSLALGLVTLAMALKSRRFIPLFGITQSLLLVPVLGALGGRLARRFAARFAPLGRPLRFVLPALAIAWGVWRLAPYPLSGNAFLYLTSQDSFPVEAMNVAEANQLSGHAFAYYNWGGYVNLRTNGRLQVFVDGREDTVFTESVYRRYMRVLGMVKGWEDVIRDSGADYFLWPARQPAQIESLRRSGDWQTLYADRVAAILVRKGRFAGKTLLPSPDSPWRELTLGWSALGAKNLRQAEEHFRRALEKMPNLRAACEWLADTQAKDARLAEAEATLDRCQKSFPEPERRSELVRLFRSRTGAMP